MKILFPKTIVADNYSTRYHESPEDSSLYIIVTKKNPINFVRSTSLDKLLEESTFMYLGVNSLTMSSLRLRLKDINRFRRDDLK